MWANKGQHGATEVFSMASYESHYAPAYASEVFGLVMLLAVVATVALDIYAVFHVF